MKINELGPDLFGFYTSEVVELLSQDDDLLPFPHIPSFPRSLCCDTGDKCSSLSSMTKNCDHNKVPHFSNAIGSVLSEFKRERLVSLLRQSAHDFTHEVEEMVYPVRSAYNLRSTMRCKKSLSNSDEAMHNDGHAQHAQKKMKTSSPPSVRSDDLDFLLENESTKVEDFIEKHSSDLADTLLYMEQNLEELLNTVMTSCRRMTMVEKEQLCILIQKLSPRNLDDVVQILGRNKPITKDELSVNLDEEDNATLWRLYFYANPSSNIT